MGRRLQEQRRVVVLLVFTVQFLGVIQQQAIHFPGFVFFRLRQDLLLGIIWQHNCFQAFVILRLRNNHLLGIIRRHNCSQAVVLMGVGLVLQQARINLLMGLQLQAVFAIRHCTVLLGILVFAIVDARVTRLQLILGGIFSVRNSALEFVGVFINRGFQQA